MHSSWQNILYYYQKLHKYMTYLQTQLIKCNIREDVITMYNIRRTDEILIITLYISCYTLYNTYILCDFFI